MISSLERKQEQRYAVLKHMYDVADERSNPTETFRAYRIVSILPYPEHEIESALAYLAGEHLAEAVVVYNGGSRSYKLTHQGVKEVEQSLQKPDEPANHFSASVNMYFNAPVGAVQTGSQATADVTQNIGADLSNVFSSLEQLKPQVTAELPPERQEDALVSIEALEDELKSQDKNPKRIKGLLAGLVGMARGTVTLASQVAVLAKQLQDLGVF